MYGIPESNIFYSRNASFAQKIRRITNGQGVDVILNSLAGDSLVASWESIASFGRFIEIGKRDIYVHKTFPMYTFAKNTSFSVVDLAAIWSQRPEVMRRNFEADESARPYRDIYAHDDCRALCTPGSIL